MKVSTGESVGHGESKVSTKTGVGKLKARWDNAEQWRCCQKSGEGEGGEEKKCEESVAY